jgi:hypothetical protein
MDTYAGYLEGLAQKGNEVAGKQARALRQKMTHLSEALMKAQTSLDTGFMPDPAVFAEFENLFKRVEAFKAGMLEKTPEKKASRRRLLQPIALPKIDYDPGEGVIGTQLMQDRIKVGQDAYRAVIEEDDAKRRMQLLDLELTEQEEKDIRKLITRLEKRRTAGGQSITAKWRKETAKLAEDLVRARRLSATIERTDREERTLRNAAAKAAERAVAALGNAPYIRTQASRKRLPGAASALRQRMMSAVSGAMSEFGMGLPETTNAGEAFLSSMFPVMQETPEIQQLLAQIEPVLDTPPEELVRRTMPSQRKKMAEEFAIAQAKIKEKNDKLQAQVAVLRSKEVDAWMENALKASIRGNKFSSRAMLDYTRQHGIPEQIMHALNGALFGGMNMGALGGKGRDQFKRLGYSGLLKQAFGDNWAGQNQALLFINALAAEVSAMPEVRGTDVEVTRRFNNLVTELSRRLAGVRPEAFKVPVDTSIGTWLKHPVDMDVFMSIRQDISTSANQGLDGIEKAMAAARSSLDALYKRRAALKRREEATLNSFRDQFEEGNFRIGELAHQAGFGHNLAGQNEALATVRRMRGTLAELEGTRGEFGTGVVAVKEYQKLQKDIKDVKKRISDAGGDTVKLAALVAELKETYSVTVSGDGALNSALKELEAAIRSGDKKRIAEARASVAERRAQIVPNQLDSIVEQLTDRASISKKRVDATKRRLREFGFLTSQQNILTSEQLLPLMEQGIAEIKKRLFGDTPAIRAKVAEINTAWTALMDKQSQLIRDIYGTTTTKEVTEPGGVVKTVEVSEGGLAARQSALERAIRDELQKTDAYRDDQAIADMRKELKLVKEKIKRRYAAMSALEPELEAVRMEMEKVRTFFGKNAPAAALVELNLLDEQQTKNRRDMAVMINSYDADMSLANAEIDQEKARLEKLMARKDKMSGFIGTLKQLIDKNVRAAKSDMLAFQAVLGEAAIGPAFPGEISTVNLANLVGNFSEGMSKALTEIIVRSVLNEDQAAEIIAQYNATLAPEVVADYARKGIEVGKAVRANLDQAKTIFGQKLVTEMLAHAEATGINVAGLLGGAVNTLDKIMDSAEIAAITQAAARGTDLPIVENVLYDPNDEKNESASSATGYVNPNSGEVSRLDRLLTGITDAKILDKEAEAERLRTALQDIETRLMQVGDEEVDAVKDHNRRVRNARRAEVKRLQKELADTKAARDSILDELWAMKTTQIEMVDNEGNQRVFAGYDEVRAFEAQRRWEVDQMVREAASNGELDSLAEKEHQIMLGILAEEERRQQELDDDLMRREAAMAAERTQRNVARMRSLPNRASEWIHGRTAAGPNPGDIAAMAQMHALDVRAGLPTATFGRDDIAAFQRQMQQMVMMQNLFNGMAGMMGHGPQGLGQMLPDDFDFRRMPTPNIPDPEKTPSGRRFSDRMARMREGARRGFGGGMFANNILDAAMWSSMSSGIDGATAAVGGLQGALNGVGNWLQGNPMMMTMFPMMEQGVISVVSAMGPWSALLIPIGIAIAGLVRNWEAFSSGITDGWNSIKGALTELGNVLIMPLKNMLAIGQTADATSSGWHRFGVIVNGVMNKLAGIIQFLANALRPFMSLLGGIAQLLGSVVGWFMRLPTSIQNVVMIMGSLALLMRATPFGMLASDAGKFSKALGLVSSALRAVTINLGATITSIKMFVMGLSTTQVALGAIAIGLGIAFMQMQHFKNIVQEGIAATNEFWAAVSQNRELGPQQNLEDASAAYADARDAYNSMLADYQAARDAGSGGGLDNLLVWAPGGRTPQDVREANEQSNFMAGELERLQELMNQTETEFNNQSEALRRLRLQYGLTNEQIMDFIRTNAPDIDVRIDPDKTVEKFQEAWNSLHQDVDGNPINPEVDMGAFQEATSKVQEFISAFRSQMQKVVDGWKEASLDAFDTVAKGFTDAIDQKLEAIDKEVAAERERQQDLDYLQKREEMRNRRRSAMLKYYADRDFAIYEGRYDDAKQIDIDYAASVEDMAKDEQDLEESRQQQLTDRMRDAERERLQIERENVELYLSVRREQLQRELDTLTEFIPKNVAEAQRMHEAIQAKMREFTGGYGIIAAEHAQAWNATWSTAMQKAKDQVAFEAYWAGKEVAKQFAIALGIDPASLDEPSPGTPSAPTPPSGRAPFDPNTTTPEDYQDRIMLPTRHTGGPMGNTSMAPADVDATLQTGEYVIRRSAVAKLGMGYLDQINRGERPLFHAGGPVDQASTMMRGGFNRAKDAFLAGSGRMFGRTAEQLKNAYRVAFGQGFAGGSGGSTSTLGRSINEIVDSIVKGTNPELTRRLTMWNAEMGNRFDITHGYRTMAQQQYLYNRWLNHVPGQAQAAPPGRSMHNFGLAVDLVPSSTTAAQRAAGAKYGLRWPMSFEPWHVEPVEAKQWRDAILGGTYPSTGGLDTGGLRLRAGLGGDGSGVTGTGVMTDIKSFVKSQMASFGWGEDQWGALDQLVQHESGWRPGAANPSSTARGLFQFLKSTWAQYISGRGGPAYWSQDVPWQTKGGLAYIKAAYGTPSNAWSKWQARSPHWYHQGGPVFNVPKLDTGGFITGSGIAEVHKGERVLNRNEVANMGGNVELNLHFDGGYFGSDRELEKLVTTIETRIMPKIQRAQGVKTRSFDKAVR